MKSSLLLFPLCLVACISPALARLDVQLTKIDESSPQDFGTAFGAPWPVGGSVYYSKTDDNDQTAATYGLYRDGSQLLAWGDTVDGYEVNNFDVESVSGNSYLLTASSNYFDAQPNTYYGAHLLFPGGQRILDMTTAYPGYPSPLPRNLIGPATLDGPRVAMHLRSTNIAPAQPSSIILWNGGSVSKIVAKGDPIPGSAATFQDFDSSMRPFATGGAVVFVGNGSGVSGIYEWSGTLRKVVDSATPAPQGGTLGTFFESRSAVKSGGDYAFITGSSATHLYKMVNNQLTLVASNSTPVPGGSGNFFNVFAPTIRNGSVVFLAWRDNQFAPPREYGIYTDFTGSIEPIVDLRTDFGGKTPSSFSMNTGQAWQDDTVYFQVTFTDKSDAIYKASFRPAVETLQSTVAFTSATTGTITVPSRTGYTYTLKRGDSPGSGTTVSTQNGSGTLLVFSFAPPSPTPRQHFFWVEESAM